MVPSATMISRKSSTARIRGSMSEHFGSPARNVASFMNGVAGRQYIQPPSMDANSLVLLVLRQLCAELAGGAMATHRWVSGSYGTNNRCGTTFQDLKNTPNEPHKEPGVMGTYFSRSNHKSLDKEFTAQTSPH